jgi:hypothetical protein
MLPQNKHNMKLDHEKVLLYIEPTQPKAAVPVTDMLYYAFESELAKTITRAHKQQNKGVTGHECMYGTLDSDLKFTHGSSWMGKHMCICGELSDANDYLLPNGMCTNILAAHYLKWHRAEVPQSELDKVLAFVTEHSRFYKPVPPPAPVVCEHCGSKIE